MEQLKRRRQKLVAALMAATTLLGGKTPPAAAMSKGLNKATTKAATNKKSGLPTWAKWLIAGGASAAGIAAIAGTIWYCLKDKNKNPQDPNETNKNPDEVKEAKIIVNKTKVKAKGFKGKEKSNLSKIEEDIKGENESQSQSGEKNKEEFQIINNSDLEKEKEEEDEKKRQEQEKEKEKREAEAEEKAKQKAKQKLEQQENKDAFYEKVKDIHPLAEAMDCVKNYEKYLENRKILGGCWGDNIFKKYKEGGNKNYNFEAYKDFKDAILKEGKKATIKKVDKEERDENIRFIKSVLKELQEKNVVHYEIYFPYYGTFNIFLFGVNKIAFRELTNAVLFEYDKLIFN